MLYHGTSDAYLEPILAHGLNPGCGLTRDRAEAERYAHTAAAWDREVHGRACRPVVIALSWARVPEPARAPDLNSIAFDASADGLLERAMGLPTREEIARAKGIDLTCWQSVMTHTGTLALAQRVGVRPADVQPLYARPADRP